VADLCLHDDPTRMASPASWLLLASLTLLVPVNGNLIDTLKDAAVKQCDKGLKKDFTVKVDTSKIGVAGAFLCRTRLVFGSPCADMLTQSNVT